MNFKFGDILENGYTSEINPYRKSIFLRKTNKFIYVRGFDGTLSEFYNDGKHKLVKVGSVIDTDKMKVYTDEMKNNKDKWTAPKNDGESN
ncbi:MAG TPA: hypothetical protein VK094_00240 [Pseudogracilibacillus sp.]|nr:hypothetical protein [Pseudogracilibacillus sp.]